MKKLAVLALLSVLIPIVVSAEDAPQRPPRWSCQFFVGFRTYRADGYHYWPVGGEGATNQAAYAAAEAAAKRTIESGHADAIRDIGVKTSALASLRCAVIDGWELDELRASCSVVDAYRTSGFFRFLSNINEIPTMINACRVN